MTNTFRTQDTRVDFVIQHYREVMDIKDCLDLAEAKLPVALQREMLKLVKGMGFEECSIADDDDAVYFHPSDSRYYTDDFEYGVYLAIAGLSWNEVVGADTDRGPWIYCGYVLQSKPNSEYKAWLDRARRAVSKAKRQLRALGIEVIPVGDYDCLLAWVSVRDLLNIDDLAHRSFGSTLKDLASAIRVFSDKLVGAKGIVPKFPI